jgi:hypothetical protein
MLIFMLDWYSGLVGYDAGDLPLKRQMVWTPATGEINYEMDMHTWFQGSFDTRIRLMRVNSDDMIYKRAYIKMLEASKSKDYNLHFPASSVYHVDFNPTKLLQGHNVFGTSVKNLGPAVKLAMRHFPKEIRPPDIDDDDLPISFSRSRVDIAQSFRIGSHADVHAWLQYAKNNSRTSRGLRVESYGISKDLTGGATVVWRSKRYWEIRAYCKFCDLEAHPPKIDSTNIDEKLYNGLREYSEGLLRIEAELHGRELKDRGTLYEYERSNPPHDDDLILWQYFDKIIWGVRKMDAEKGIERLRPPVRAIYELWLAGRDVRPGSGLIKRASFYNYMKEIKEATGQDITLSPSEKPPAADAREKTEKQYLMEHEEKIIPDDLKSNLIEPPITEAENRFWPAHPPGYKAKKLTEKKRR